MTWSGGHAVGMKTVGVLYGYGSRQELESVHADYICQSMTDLQTTLLALGAESATRRDAS